MNKNLQTVFKYHEQTKHSPQRYARSLGYMDWATQPNPFRNYKGSESFLLPLALDNPTPPYHLLNSDLPSAPLLKESLSQFLQFSMGIAAWKSTGADSWAVRCNASSGNLHPTETYLVMPPVMNELENKSAVLHYTPQNHGLEILTLLETSFWDELPKGSFLVGLSGISWREVWKYGERAFRYVNLDAGHAWQSLVVSAKMLGWNIQRFDNVNDTDIDKLFGFTQESRFFEKEYGDILLLVSPQKNNNVINLDKLLDELPMRYNGIANKLSTQMHHWDIIDEIEDATSVMQIPQDNVTLQYTQNTPTQESKDIVLKRRSVHVMDKESSTITKEQFHTLLKNVSYSLDGKENSAHLVIFVHRVEEYQSGIYILYRNNRDKELLQELMHNDFLYEQTDLENLFILEYRDTQMISNSISCSQDIASDGAFSLGMLCNFSEQLLTYGAHRYKELYWECGAIGQQLYLDATSMGLSGTGIGCYLDDTMHNLLGLKDNRLQTLYHFTVGRGYVDSRIQTKPAYEENR
jgi:SagB-type dehydrogenase family enzyme